MGETVKLSEGERTPQVDMVMDKLEFGCSALDNAAPYNTWGRFNSAVII